MTCLKGFGTPDEIVEKIVETADFYTHAKQTALNNFHEIYEITCLSLLLQESLAWMMWNRMEYDFCVENIQDVI